MIVDLKREWDERALRKSAYTSKAFGKALPINFADYTQSCTRTEMPNKFNKAEVPKVGIEQVYQMKIMKKNHSTVMKGGPFLSPGHKNNLDENVEDRPFYYTENNEIMSIEEFFKVYKEMEIYRKSQNKILLKERLDEKRRKIEELTKTHRNSSDEHTSPESSPLKESRPQTGLSKSARPFSAFHHTSGRLSNYSQEIYNDVSGNMIDQPSELKSPQRVTIQVPETTVKHTVRPKSGMTTQQKFTEKEIYRHLIHMTVSPKPLRTDQATIQKEKVYTTMFKAPHVMDHTIEHSIRRANKIILRDSEDEGICFASALIKDGHRKTEVPTPTKAEDLKLNAALQQKILGHMNNIDEMLKNENRRPKTALMKKQKSQPIVRRLGNLVPLRATVEQKHGFIEKIRQHKDLSRKMKDLTKSYKKEIGESRYTSQAYACHYL
jgi:hypothetical protein